MIIEKIPANTLPSWNRAAVEKAEANEHGMLTTEAVIFDHERDGRARDQDEKPPTEEGENREPPKEEPHNVSSQEGAPLQVKSGINVLA